MKNGNVIKAKVLEVGLEEVKYELYTKEGGGAVYTVSKNKIEVMNNYLIIRGDNFIRSFISKKNEMIQKFQPVFIDEFYFSTEFL